MPMSKWCYGARQVKTPLIKNCAGYDKFCFLLIYRERLFEPG